MNPPPVSDFLETSRRSLESHLQRIVVVGTSGSGKTTIVRQLAQLLGSRLIELDALHWLPNWTEEQPDAFRRKVRDAVRAPRWIVDGNYGNVRDLIWPSATSVVWLDYSFPRVFWRVLVRTIRRNVGGEVLFGGNRESLRRSFLSRDSILLWVINMSCPGFHGHLI